MANTTIRLKKSGVSGNVPSSLELGELALNYYDAKLYYKNASGTISYVTNQQSFATINANSTLVLASGSSDTLSISSSNGINVSANSISKSINFSASNASTSQSGIVQLNDTYLSVSTTQAATANAVHAVYTYAQSIQSDVGIVPISISLASNSANQVIDSFALSTYSTAKYICQIKNSTNIHVSEIIIMTDGTNSYINEYGTMYSTPLGTFDSTISTGNLQLLFSPTNSNTNINIKRITLST